MEEAFEELGGKRHSMGTEAGGQDRESCVRFGIVDACYYQGERRLEKQRGMVRQRMAIHPSYHKELYLPN